MKMVVYQPRREALEENTPADIVISGVHLILHSYKEIDPVV